MNRIKEFKIRNVINSFVDKNMDSNFDTFIPKAEVYSLIRDIENIINSDKVIKKDKYMKIIV